MPGSLLEAVGFLLSIPDGSGQGKLLPHPVFVHRSQRAAPQLLSLLVVRFEPQRLQLRMRLFGELVVLQDMVEFTEIASVERDDSPGPEHRLVLVEDLAGRWRDGQRPEEAAQALDIPALLQSLADPGDLLGAEIQDGQLKHGGFSRVSLSPSFLLSPLSLSLSLLRAESSASSSRAPRQSKTTQKTRQSQSYRTNRLTSREKTHTPKTPQRRDNAAWGPATASSGLGKLGRQRAEGARGKIKATAAV